MKKVVEEYMQSIQTLAVDAVGKILLIQEELSAWQHRALELIVQGADQDLCEQHLAEIEVLGLDPSKFTLISAANKIAEISGNLTAEVMDFCGEIRALDAPKLLGIPDPELVCGCGHTLDRTDEFCPSCGTRVGAKEPYKAPETISCRKCICGRTYRTEFKFCPSCGCSAEKSLSERQQSIAETFGL